MDSFQSRVPCFVPTILLRRDYGIQLTYQTQNFTDVRYFLKNLENSRELSDITLVSAFPFQLLVQKNYCNDTCKKFGDTNTRAFYGVF